MSNNMTKEQQNYIKDLVNKHESLTPFESAVKKTILEIARIGRIGYTKKQASELISALKYSHLDDFAFTLYEQNKLHLLQNKFAVRDGQVHWIKTFIDSLDEIDGEGEIDEVQMSELVDKAIRDTYHVNHPHSLLD